MLRPVRPLKPSTRSLQSPISSGERLANIATISAERGNVRLRIARCFGILLGHYLLATFKNPKQNGFSEFRASTKLPPYCSSYLFELALAESGTDFHPSFRNRLQTICLRQRFLAYGVGVKAVNLWMVAHLDREASRFTDLAGTGQRVIEQLHKIMCRPNLSILSK